MRSYVRSKATSGASTVMPHPHVTNRAGLGGCPPPENSFAPAGFHESGHNAINFEVELEKYCTDIKNYFLCVFRTSCDNIFNKYLNEHTFETRNFFIYDATP